MSDFNTASDSVVNNNQRLTQKQKDKNDKEWYKQQINRIASRAFSSTLGYGEVNEYTRKKVNYDLFNNIIDIRDFEYVCQPYGANQGEMPAKMVNRDIVSGKLKVLIGMEMQRPFNWKIIATNEEATTRKIEERNRRLSQFVISEIMTPIEQEIELKYQEQMKGRSLTEDEQNQLRQQIQSEISAQTPPEVERYMIRKHKDPAEVLSSQILNYLYQEQHIPFKFNVGWKHAMLAGEELYWTGIVNGKPVLRIVNPLYFDYERSPENFFVEESSWACHRLRLTPSEIVQWFGSELTEDEIDTIYTQYPYGTPSIISAADFNPLGYAQEAYTIEVLHTEFKSLRLVKFLQYLSDETGQVEEMIVPEEYQLDIKHGDITIREEWIPEVHEGYRIGNDIFKSCQPVPGQHKDIYNLYDSCKLRYHGTSYDSLNSEITAPMDRVKPHQYFYDIIMYRIEMLIASDKGKKLLLNINMIPKSAGIDIKKWAYYLDAIGIGWMNPNEEGNKHSSGNIGEAGKEIDLSLASQINNYIMLADKIEERAGLAIGVTRQMEGQLNSSDAVTNTKQSIVQSSYIIEPLFNQHNEVKQRVLQSLIDQAKIAYTINPPDCLNYILDDMSLAMIKFDAEACELLENSTIGLFVSNDSKSVKAKDTIEQLAHAAVQNDKADLSDIIKIIRSDSVQESEELLEVSETRKRKEKTEANSEALKAQAQENEKARNFTRETWKHERDLVVLKETERRETEVQKATVQAIGFNENKDMNNNNVPDVLDVANHMLDSTVKTKQLELNERKTNHQIANDKEKNKLIEKKLEIDKLKAKQKPKS